MAISKDPIEELASWARDADFPMLFVSDADGTTFEAFGTGGRESGSPGHRMVAVLDPEGRVAFVASPFREIDPLAYEELEAAVAAVAPDLAVDEGGDVDSLEELKMALAGGDC